MSARRPHCQMGNLVVSPPRRKCTQHHVILSADGACDTTRVSAPKLKVQPFTVEARSGFYIEQMSPYEVFPSEVFPSAGTLAVFTRMADFLGGSSETISR